ncbi:MAG: redoxin family protein [Puniceicoccales bacterium]|jgi:nucleoredoxin|nr:redoxin family protein [Puniceicoccales bacterium]
MKKIYLFLSLLLATTIGLQAADEVYHKELLKGTEDSLVKADKSKASVEALQSKKYTFIYFSAHWCPPCRAFTPKLVNFYNENSKNGDFELLFVSSDKDQEKMYEYMTETKMPWIGLKKDSPKGREFSKKYGVSGIPTLVLLNEKDEVIASSYDSEGKYKGAGVAMKKYEELHKKK